MILVAGEKDFKCGSCGNSFAQAGNLKGHIKAIHECHKDFNCDYCGKSSYQATDLRKHIKDVKCDSCGNHFLILIT